MNSVPALWDGVGSADGARLLTPATLKESTEQMIRRALLNGDMRAGEIYSANALARQLGISNSPAREAMMTLVNKGLLELVRNRGFRVVELSDTDKREIYELRLQIEVEAVRRVAAAGVSTSETEFLRAAAQRTVNLAQRDDMGDYLEADQSFHAGLVGMNGNRRWTDIVENLRDLSRVNGFYRFLATDHYLAESADEHLRIAAAVIAGDAERAAELMVHHLEYARPRG